MTNSGKILKKKPITLAQVAREAGVSRTSAYYVLHPNNAGNVGVSDATRERIEEAAQRVGYIVDHTARTLVSGRSQSIGLLLGNPDLAFEQKLSICHRNVYARHGHTLHLEFHKSDPKEERERLTSLISRNVDCLFISRCNFEDNVDLLERFVERGIPVIILGTEKVGSQFHYLSFDEDRGMNLLLDHLGENGWREILFLGYKNGMSWASSNRLKNLTNAMEQHPDISLVGEEKISDYASCKEVLQGWFAEGKDSPPRAIVAYNDRLAGVVLWIMQQLGIDVPGQAAVVGVDGIYDPFLPLSLTSVCLPLTKHAEKCWQMYDALLKGQNPDAGGCYLVEPELIIGESTAAIPVDCLGAGV